MFDYKASSYHELRHHEFLKDRDLRCAWGYFADITYFKDVKDGSAILEFGGGLGSNLLTVKDRANCSMIEPSYIGREIALGHGIRVFESLDEVIDAFTYDVVLCRHVLEHVIDPKATLDAIHSILREDGQLIVVVPCESWRKMPDKDDLDHHLFCWNPQTLSYLLELSGFSVARIHFEYYGAKRKLLPVYRRFGGSVYASLVRMVGKVFGFRELVVEACPSFKSRG